MTALSYKYSLNKPQKISVKAPLKTSADCKTYAERIAYENLRAGQLASGSCVGIPDIVPGCGLGIQGIDSLWEKRVFFVDSVTHRLNTSGYTTSFKIKGWF
jgi:phage protein D